MPKELLNQEDWQQDERDEFVTHFVGVKRRGRESITVLLVKEFEKKYTACG